ncbi:MAG TPA: hypothetical protein VL443_24060 [Cyclobacteriaceae bacterium]|jgi:hypothetical protein|nr:hypothetical protein [Cyclobacteriaceae bacterium]
MKTIKIIIGIAAVITAIYMFPKPVASKPFSSFEKQMRLETQIDSMEFANKMSVWSK